MSVKSFSTSILFSATNSAQTDVGKKVSVKIWRNQKEITKTITLGRLETSEDFQTQKTESAPKTTLIKGLKISVRKLCNMNEYT